MLTYPTTTGRILDEICGIDLTQLTAKLGYDSPHQVRRDVIIAGSVPTKKQSNFSRYSAQTPSAHNKAARRWGSPRFAEARC